MLEELIGKKLVVDLHGCFVCLGTLQRVDEHHLELRDADLHDLHTQSSRENSCLAVSRIQAESQAGHTCPIGSGCVLTPGRCGG